MSYRVKGKFIVVMGVSGCGKSTLAKRLAWHLDYQFVEADDFHSEECKTQMAQGIGLTDEQRMPWLQGINQHCRNLLALDNNIVLACSALKRQYRSMLSQKITDSTFIWIDVSQECIQKRLESRTGHFANERLLHSQFDALEAPDNESGCIRVDGELSSEVLLSVTLEKLANA